MQQENIAKKRAVVLFSAIAMYAVALGTLPGMVARHGGRPVWVIIPLVAAAAFSFAYLVRELAKAKRNGGFDGLQ